MCAQLMRARIFKEKMIRIESERLIIEPRNFEEMSGIYESEKDPIMKQAYREMIDTMLKYSDRSELGCEWKILLRDGTLVGGACFKGLPDERGSVEIGYGTFEAYQCRGYMTEAVGALCDWALSQPDVHQVEAQIEEGNIASEKVLLKNGFIRNGDGEEGPLFVKY